MRLGIILNIELAHLFSGFNGTAIDTAVEKRDFWNKGCCFLQSNVRRLAISFKLTLPAWYEINVHMVRGQERAKFCTFGFFLTYVYISL